MQTVSRFCAITLDTLLYGNSTLSLQANSDILGYCSLDSRERNVLLFQYYCNDRVESQLCFSCINHSLRHYNLF